MTSQPAIGAPLLCALRAPHGPEQSHAVACEANVDGVAALRVRTLAVKAVIGGGVINRSVVEVSQDELVSRQAFQHSGFRNKTLADLARRTCYWVLSLLYAFAEVLAETLFVSSMIEAAPYMDGPWRCGRVRIGVWQAIAAAHTMTFQYVSTDGGRNSLTASKRALQKALAVHHALDETMVTDAVAAAVQRVLRSSILTHTTQRIFIGIGSACFTICAARLHCAVPPNVGAQGFETSLLQLRHPKRSEVLSSNALYVIN